MKSGEMNLKSIGIVTDYITQIVQRQVDERGIVVGFDPDRVYQPLLAHLDLPEPQILQFTGSFLRLSVMLISISIMSCRKSHLASCSKYSNPLLSNHILNEFILNGPVCHRVTLARKKTQKGWSAILPRVLSRKLKNLPG